MTDNKLIVLKWRDGFRDQIYTADGSLSKRIENRKVGLLPQCQLIFHRMHLREMRCFTYPLLSLGNK
jgi:hypothetical protein